MKLHDKKLNINVSTKQFTISADKEYIDIEGYASKMYNPDGSLKVDLDGENVQTSNFKLEAKRLLLNHDIEEPVGDLELTHKPDGIWLKARAYKDTMSEKEFNRLRRGLYDFSIGFIPTEAEYVNVKGKDVLSFTAGTIYETSLVAIPSNNLATIEHMKSVNTKGCVGFECSIENIKAMNPNQDCSCLTELKNEDTETQREKMLNKEALTELFTKGLTIEETANESWNISDDFWRIFDYFNQTVRDNWDAFRWEGLTNEEMLSNLTLAFEAFKEIAQNTAMRINQVNQKSVNDSENNTENTQDSGDIVNKTTTTLEGKDMPNKTKSVDTNTETTEGQEVQVENTTEVDENTETESNTTQETSTEVTTANNDTNLESEENSEDTNEGTVIKTEETTVTDDSAVKAEPLDVRNEVIAILSTDLDKASDEEIESMYNALADKLGDLYSAHEALSKIEQFVKENI